VPPKPRGPYEAIGLPQKVIERETSFTEARVEAAEGCEASCDVLNPLEVVDRAHFGDGCDISRVGFDAALRNDET
jgi:hypothetical protein